MGIPHDTVYLRLCDHSRNRVEDDAVYCPGAHQCLRNFKGLFAAVGLGYKEIVYIHAQCLCVYRVKGVLHVDECGIAPRLLRLCHAVQGNSCLTGGFGPVYLHYAPLGETPNAKRHIKLHGACGNSLHIHIRRLTQAHYRSLAVGLFKVSYGRIKGLLLFIRIRELHRSGLAFFFLVCHVYHSYLYNVT